MPYKYIFAQLEELPEGERADAAAEFLRKWDDPPHIVYDVPTARQISWQHSDAALEEIRVDGKEFYERLRPYFRGSIPQVYWDKRKIFERNCAAVVRLKNLGSRAWREPLRAFPPYAGDFSREIAVQIGSKDYEATTQLLGRGAFADVYAGTGPSGAVAIKIYRPRDLIDPVVRDDKLRYQKALLDNLKKIQPELPPSCVQIQKIYGNIVIMERFGHSVKWHDLREDPALAHRAVRGYGTMLKELHERGYVRGDNS